MHVEPAHSGLGGDGAGHLLGADGERRRIAGHVDPDHGFASRSVHDGGESLRRHTAVNLAIDHHRGREGAIAEAVDRLEGDGAVGGGAVELDAESLAGVVDEPIGAHRLAGLGATDVHQVTAGRSSPEVVIEADDAMHLGAAQVERGGDGGNGVGRHVSELVLDGVQDREQRAGTMAILLDGDGDGRFPVDGGHTAAARVSAGITRARMKSAMASTSFRSMRPGPSNGASVAMAMRSGSLAQSGARPCAGR